MILPETLEPYRQRIEATLRPCLTVTAGSTSPSLLSSRVGGSPTLPEGFPWPREGSGRPLRFLAQLNFFEIPPLENFPRRGLLVFFLADNRLYGRDYKHPRSQDGFRLLYFPELPQEPYLDTDALELPPLQDFPVRDHHCVGLEFEAARMPVTGSDYSCQNLGFETYGDFDTYADLFSGGGHRLGGYPGFEQDDPRKSRLELQDYELLFQLDSDENMKLMWGDAGIAHFFIKPEALGKADFSDVMYHWDGG